MDEDQTELTFQRRLKLSQIIKKVKKWPSVFVVNILVKFQVLAV